MSQLHWFNIDELNAFDWKSKRVDESKGKWFNIDEPNRDELQMTRGVDGWMSQL